MAYQKRNYKKKSPFKKTAPVGRFLKTTAKYTGKGLTTAGKIASLSRDIAILKGLNSAVMKGLNVEKKYKDRDVVDGHFGQVNHNANGIYMVDVTPDITQGLQGDQRIGNSVKLTGMSFPIQFTSSLHTISARKIKVMLVKVNAADNGVTETEAINDLYDVNPINGIIDMNSPRAYRTHKHDGVKVIRSKVYTLKALNHTLVGDDDNTDQLEASSFMAKFNVKLNEVVRYNANGDTKPDGCRYYMYFFADKGNVGNTNSTLDVPVTVTQSGVQFRLGQRSWWVDN
jgi:hypothetical protein